MFGGVFLLGYTSRITSVLFDIGLPVNIVLVLFYRIYKKYGRFRKTVILLRTTAIIIFVLGLLAPVVLLNFKHTKSMYPIKRFCYSYGNYGVIDNNILPSFLPKKCDDYMFITQGSFPAQDYHPSAYLAFHTDSETLKKYENHFDSLNNAELKVTHMPDKEKSMGGDDSWSKCPEELSRHVFWTLQPEHIHDFKNAIIYTVPSYYGKGCMLDYDSGLAVFWY